MQPETKPESPQTLPVLAPHWQLVIVSTLVGLGLRGLCLYLAPQHSYLPDHLDNLAWGTWAFENGPWAIYDLPAEYPMLVRVADAKAARGAPGAGAGGFVERLALAPHAYNYPPASAYLFWLQGAAWNALDADVRERRLPPQLAQKLGIEPLLRTRVLDTHASRIAAALPAIACDLLMAVGLALLVRRLAGPGRPLAAAGAFALVLVAPPIILNSSFWTHTDSWIMAVLVWCMWALLSRRFWLVGVLMGVALVVKAQAILLGPVLLFVFLALRLQEGGSWRAALRLVRAGGLSLGVIAALAGPFMAHDAGAAGNADGAWRWFQRGYRGAIVDPSYARTTLSAFNVWWLEWMAGGASGDALRSSSLLMGVSKDALGKGLLALSIVLTFAVCGLRGAWRDESWLVCAFLVTFAAFMLPTRVHERYVYYCLPFVIALAMLDRKRWLAPLLALLIVASAEMLSFGWLSNERGPRAIATGLSALSVLTLLVSFASAAWRPPRPRSAAER